MSVPSPTGVASAEDERRRLRPYAAYKDSGVQWLGRVPAHWEVRRLKTVASVHLSNVDKKSYEGQEPVMLCNYTHVYNNEHITSGLDFMPATATSEQLRRFSLHAGDVLITKDSESWTDIAVPAFIQSDLPGVLCGYHLALVRPAESEGLGAFLAPAFSAIGVRDQLQIAATGVTRFGLSGDAIEAALFAIPPSDEYRAISAFLARETAKIDALIAKKERLIELLQEKRTAVISHVVCRGLDPHVAMKDSEFEWLGQIPVGWRAGRVRNVVRRIEQGWSPECESREATEGEWGVLKAGCVNRGVFIESENKALPASIDPIPSLEISEGDLLMSRASGSPELVGSVAVVPRCRPRLLLCDKVFRLGLSHEVAIPRFLAYALTSSVARWQIQAALSGGSGLANNIAQAVVKDLVVVLPSPEEQAAIADWLDQRIATIDGLIGSVRDAIGRLQELRAALVSAVVMGRIDVREQ